ncbi:ribonuclease pancreatic-like [Petaurus breviceps papuanus]|uniref:ribonuclease pancreatic-like n=1 Tax=Petaurus breviceps papuanus TaxID=3040969 RepID=UPI0036DE0C6D
MLYKTCFPWGEGSELGQKFISIQRPNKSQGLLLVGEATMALKSSHMALVLLGLLLVGLAQLSAGKESAAKKFQRQHMDTEHLTANNSNYCNLMMKSRKMTTDRCKPVNTFIHEPKEVVDAVCQETNISCKNGQPNCHQSSLPLTLTNCRQTGSSKYPNCQYKASYHISHIIVACEGEVYVPVHFDAYV